MTYHVPQSRRRLFCLVAKGMIVRRSTLAGVGLVAATGIAVADYDRSGSDPRHGAANTMALIASFAPVETPPTGSTADRHPPLLAAEDRDSVGALPEAPVVVPVRLAALAPATGDLLDLGDDMLPRLPELGRLPVAPGLEGAFDNLDAVPSIHPVEPRSTVTTVVSENETSLEALLEQAGLTGDDRHATLVAMRADTKTQIYPARTRVDVAYADEVGGLLLGVRLQEPEKTAIELRWDGETTPLWENYEGPRPTLGGVPASDDAPKTVLLSGTIKSSLYASASKAGMTPRDAQRVADVFRYIVDFQRDLRKGDEFEALFERKDDGTLGTIVYAKLTNRGSKIALYRGLAMDGTPGYFDATGRSNKRSIMRTPIAGAKISSRFGMRLHPILGYNKMHRGVDFSAPRGTPIFAAGDGIVEYAGYRGAYGKFIRIRHSGKFETAYAHLSRFAPVAKPGQRVRQGDVIGYVGSTGRSTGPHLHFEIREHGTRVNPMAVADFGPVEGLSGAALSALKVKVARVEVALGLLRSGSRVASIPE